MTRLHLLAPLVAIAIAAPAAAAPLPMSRPIVVDGTTVVCTGLDQRSRNDPRWKSFPVLVSFANDDGQYLSNVKVRLRTSGGHTLAAIDCLGPWVLFRVPPGHYRVHATLLGATHHPSSSKAFSIAGQTGQQEVTVTFKSAKANH